MKATFAVFPYSFLSSHVKILRKETHILIPQVETIRVISALGVSIKEDVMTVRLNNDPRGKFVILEYEGQLSYSDLIDTRDMYAQLVLEGQDETIEIDMEYVTYLDLSIIEYLLRMREKLVIIHTSSHVRAVFRENNLERTFRMPVAWLKKSKFGGYDIVTDESPEAERAFEAVRRCEGKQRFCGIQPRKKAKRIAAAITREFYKRPVSPAQSLPGGYDERFT